MHDDQTTINHCFGKVYEKKAALSQRVYAEIFEKVPESRDLMDDGPLPQKEGFIGVLIGIMKTPQTGPEADQRMARLRHMHRDMGITADQVRLVGDIICTALKAELSADLTLDQLAAWCRSVSRFAADLAEGLEQPL